MNIVWTRLALSDLDHAYHYIADESPDSALHVIDRIEEALRGLSRFPGMGRAGRIEGTRELVISNTPFIMAYRVGEKRVEVLSLIHASRKWPESL